MPRLFWKIFGWFWGAMVTIGLSLWLVVLTTRPDPMPESWRQNTGAALRATAAVAVAEWERGGAPALRATLRNAGHANDARFRLLDQNGERLGRARPDASDAASAGAPGANPNAAPDANSNGAPGALPNAAPGANPNARANGANPNRRADSNRTNVNRAQGNRANGNGANGTRPDANRGSDERGFDRVRPEGAWRERLKKLIARATESGEPKFELWGERAIAAVRETSQNRNTYVLLADLPRPQSGRAVAAARTQLLGGLVALALSGLVCWGLVRYLTAPLFALRGATRKFAAGDLAARTGAPASGRRDEVADLGRDFDAMAERIENLVEGQRQLLGDISHELRSPLARLRMANALGARQIESGASGSEFAPAFERISRETARLDALIGQLLDLTRLENGGQSAFESVDVTALIQEIAADARFEAQAHCKDVIVTRADALTLCGAPVLLSSAIENVVRNALRHTAPQTSVEIALEASGEAATIRVRDHGSGVPPETLGRIFEPFFRVEEARDRQSGGAGLGLAIVERAVHAHNGSVGARNAENGGLEVEIRLPLTRCL